MIFDGDNFHATPRIVPIQIIGSNEMDPNIWILQSQALYCVELAEPW